MSISNRPEGRTLGAVKARRAFSLIELVIVVVIIGIIAAIAIPRMSRGSAGAADSALAQNLAILRNAIDMFQTEHGGVFPGAAAGSPSVEKLLLEYSNAAGDATSATKTGAFIYGPYLRSVPPLTVGANKGKSGINAVATDALPAVTTNDSNGWRYSYTSGIVGPNTSGVDGTGKDYSSY